MLVLISMNSHNKKLVVFVIDSFDVGGVQTYVLNQTKALNKLNIETAVLGCRGNLIPEEFFTHSNNFVIPKTIEETKQGLNNLRIFFDYSSVLKKIFNIYSNYDIFIHTSSVRSSAYTLINPNSWDKTQITTFHGAQFLELRQFFVNQNIFIKVKILLFKIAQYIVLYKADRIIVLSKYSKNLIRDEFSSRFLSKTYLIPGFIDRNPPIKRSRSQVLTLTNIGRIEPRKGIELLIKALAILKKDRTLFKCYISSPTKYWHWFTGVINTYEKERLFDSVHFIHMTNDDEKKELLSRSDIFVLPSLDLETFGYVTIEAMQNGVIVLGSNSGSTPEILKRVDKRLLFKSNSSDQLAKKIKWFIGLNKNERAKIERRSKQIQERYFSLKANIAKVASVYVSR